MSSVVYLLLGESNRASARVSGLFESLDAIVIGGGITGLTAAHALRNAGRRVALLEAAPVFGGCMGTLRNGPYVADMGPQTIVATQEVQELVDELGLRERVLRTEPAAKKRYIYRGGRLMPVPAGPGELIVTPLLSAGAKWRLLAEPFIARRTDDVDESIASFVARRAGPELVDAVVGPAVSGVFAGDPARLSVRSALPALVKFEREYGSVTRGFLAQRRELGRTPQARDMIGFTGGNATLIDTLVGRLQSHAYTNARVTRIFQRGAGFALECDGLPERSIEAARVIIATSAGSAGYLLEPLEPGAAAALHAIESPPLAQVVVAYPRASVGVPLDGFGFLACRNEGVRMLGAVWNSVIFRERCPDDEVLLTAFLGGATDPAVAQCTDAELANIAHQDLLCTMHIRDDVKPKVIAGFRWASAIPQYAIAHEQRLAQIAKGMGRIPGLFLSGNYLDGARVADCIRRGQAFARLLPHNAVSDV
jgi:oxygen-dependent protoporphyrinogen oxidase